LTVASPLLERLAARPERFPGALLLHATSAETLEKTSSRLGALLLCPGDDPENRCESCRRAFEGIHPDLLTLEPEGVQIRVDRVREAIAFGAGRPYESARRVVRISRAELLGLEAANALLKSLEEPGSLLHWILTTRRPEALLPTIRSRCLAVRVASGSASDRARAWREAGFPEGDAADLAIFTSDENADADRLENARRFRLEAVEALRAGIVDGKLASLVLLAEILGRAEPEELRVLGELLADAALIAAGVSAELVRHRAVLNPLSEIARRAGATALEKAAVATADYPPDTRRGNRRLHFEKVLLGLSASTVASHPAAESFASTQP
jgi:DNA polymerase III, delta subunit